MSAAIIPEILKLAKSIGVDEPDEKTRQLYLMRVVRLAVAFDNSLWDQLSDAATFWVDASVHQLNKDAELADPDPPADAEPETIDPLAETPEPPKKKRSKKKKAPPKVEANAMPAPLKAKKASKPKKKAAKKAAQEDHKETTYDEACEAERNASQEKLAKKAAKEVKKAAKEASKAAKNPAKSVVEIERDRLARIAERKDAKAFKADAAADPPVKKTRARRQTIKRGARYMFLRYMVKDKKNTGYEAIVAKMAKDGHTITMKGAQSLWYDARTLLTVLSEQGFAFHPAATQSEEQAS